MSGSIYDTFVNSANEVSEESVGMAVTGIRIFEDPAIEPSYLKASIGAAVENRLGNDGPAGEAPGMAAKLDNTYGIA